MVKFVHIDTYDSSNDTTKIKITDESVPFNGVIFQYKTIKFVLENEGTPDEYGAVKFTYDIINNNGLSEKDLTHNLKFNNYLGDILNELLVESIERGAYKLGKREDNIKISTKESID